MIWCRSLDIQRLHTKKASCTDGAARAPAIRQSSPSASENRTGQRSTGLSFGSHTAAQTTAPTTAPGAPRPPDAKGMHPLRISRWIHLSCVFSMEHVMYIMLFTKQSDSAVGLPQKKVRPWLGMVCKSESLQINHGFIHHQSYKYIIISNYKVITSVSIYLYIHIYSIRIKDLIVHKHLLVMHIHQCYLSEAASAFL